MKTTSQVEQLKLNVSNINSFLISKNKEQKKLKSDKKRLELRRADTLKREKEERKLEIKSSPVGKVSEKVKESVSSGGSILDKLLNFGGLLLAGILVNNLPAIIDKVKGIIDSVVNFITPIQSGFNLLKAFFTGDLDNKELDVDKKRFDDALSQLDGEGGLLDRLAKKAGPLEPIIKALKPLVGKIRDAVGGKKMALHKQDGKEGVLNTETGEFTEKQFTSAERERFEKGDVMIDGGKSTEQESAGGQTSEGSSTGQASSGTTLNYGLVNPTPNTNILENKGGYAADTGLDIIGKVGDPIVSPVDGILEYAERGHTAQMGQDSDPTKPGIQDQLSFRIRLNKPFIFEGKKVNFVYGTHLATLDTAVANRSGIPIKAGQRLGTMGVANNVPHLHIGFVEDRAQTGFLNFKEVRRLLSGQSSNGEKKGAAGLMKGVRKDEKNKQISVINQPDPRKKRGSMTIAVQRVNTIQTVPYMMPVPTKSRSSSTSQPQLPSIWSA